MTLRRREQRHCRPRQRKACCPLYFILTLGLLSVVDLSSWLDLHHQAAAFAFQHSALSSRGIGLTTKTTTTSLSRVVDHPVNLSSKIIVGVPNVQRSSQTNLSYRSSLRLTKDDNEEKEISTPLDNPVLAALDVAALIAFAAIGKSSHSPSDGSLDFGAVLVTAFPFVLSWLATSPLTNIYQSLPTSEEQDDNGGSVVAVGKSAIQQTLPGWAVAVPLGCALRGLIKGYVPPIPFVIVTLLSTLVILSVVRVLYALLVPTTTNTMTTKF